MPPTEEATTERPEVLVTSAATVRTHAPALNANISSHPRGSLREGRMIEVTGGERGARGGG